MRFTQRKTYLCVGRALTRRLRYSGPSGSHTFNNTCTIESAETYLRASALGVGPYALDFGHLKRFSEILPRAYCLNLCRRARLLAVEA